MNKRRVKAQLEKGKRSPTAFEQLAELPKENVATAWKAMVTSASSDSSEAEVSGSKAAGKPTKATRLGKGGTRVTGRPSGKGKGGVAAAAASSAAAATATPTPEPPAPPRSDSSGGEPPPLVSSSSSYDANNNKIERRRPQVVSSSSSETSCEGHAYMNRAEDEDEEFIPVPGYEGVRESAQAASSSTSRQDKMMMYGEYRGKMYSQIMVESPDYARELEKTYRNRKSTPKYVTAFLEYAGIGSTESDAKDRKPLPEKRMPVSYTHLTLPTTPYV